MAFRVGALVAGGAIILAAGLLALLHTERAPEPEGTTSPGAAAPQSPSQNQIAPSEPSPARPPRPPESASGDDPPAIVWKVPNGWQSAPNPNGMRLATYSVADPAGGDPVEVSVSRAGGSTEANIQRWQGQFANTDQARRAEKTVRGLAVTIVEIAGTYSSGAMMPGAPAAAPRAGWALVAAIVPAAASSYFFKMLGPVQKVHAARGSFDTLIDSLAPR